MQQLNYQLSLLQELHDKSPNERINEILQCIQMENFNTLEVSINCLFYKFHQYIFIIQNTKNLEVIYLTLCCSYEIHCSLR